MWTGGRRRRRIGVMVLAQGDKSGCTCRGLNVVLHSFVDPYYERVTYISHPVDLSMTISQNNPIYSVTQSISYRLDPAPKHANAPSFFTLPTRPRAQKSQRKF